MNIKRAELKSQAKAVLSTKYWHFFAVLAIYQLIPVILTPSMKFMYAPAYTAPLTAAILAAFSILLGLISDIFLVKPIYVSVCRFVVYSSVSSETKFSVIWDILKENYINIVGATFMRSVFSTLWTLPFIAIYTLILVLIMIGSSSDLLFAMLLIALIFTIVLALYKVYSYSMLDYIVAENPRTSWREALSESKRMMRGKTFFAFKLGLSFLGWYLLGLLSFGIGMYFVPPYVIATQAQFYLFLKKEQYGENPQYSV